MVVLPILILSYNHAIYIYLILFGLLCFVQGVKNILRGEVMHTILLRGWP
jgi:hypothetical protein